MLDMQFGFVGFAMLQMIWKFVQPECLLRTSGRSPVQDLDATVNEVLWRNTVPADDAVIDCSNNWK